MGDLTRRLLATFPRLLAALAAAGAGCAAPPATSPEPPVVAPAPGPPPGTAPSPAAATAARARPTPPDPATIFARIARDLTACYELGRRATPEMTDGKVTLNASVDEAGTTTCVIPSDHTGLTQDVEDCMAARLASERFDAGAPWSASVPIVLRGGALKLGERKPDAVTIESVETIRMPDAFDALESLEPALQACVRGHTGGAKSMLVAARVGADGRAQCALAASAGALPAAAGDCAAGVLRSARFPAPKRGSGLVIVPILLR